MSLRAPRLFGQETEYAIRFATAPGHRRPGHSRIFHAFRYAIKRIVKIRPGEWLFFLENFFTENGGAFNYEALPQAPEAGLIEGATPECHSPTELVLYQRAQEALLLQALPAAAQHLARRGYPGELGLIKNCRDAEGHIYGAQESYECDLGQGWRLWCYRLGIGVCLVPVVFWWIFYLMLISTIVVIVLGGQLILWLTYSFLHALLELPGRLFAQNWLRAPARWLVRVKRGLQKTAMRVARSESFLRVVAWSEYAVIYPVTFVILWPYARLLHLFAFRPQRRTLTAFLISRPVLSGAGTLLANGSFALSEKGTAVRRIFRTTVSPGQRPLFDSGNLHKAFILAGFGLVLLRFDSVRRLFRRRARLQIGMSDSNRAQFAEYLKVGTMLLVLDAAEAGFLRAAPRPRHPRRALRTLVHDSGLQAKIAVRGRPAMSALEIQRWYLERVREYLGAAQPGADAAAAGLSAAGENGNGVNATGVNAAGDAAKGGGHAALSLEAWEIVRLWQECLDALEVDPGKLIGRLDWVSKRYLLEAAGQGIPFAARKRIDIGYHELGAGYFDRLEEAGIAPRLVDEESVQAAIRRPSSPARVQARSRLIRGVEYPGRRVQISWNSVRVGYWWNQQIVSLDEYRDRPSKK